MFDRTVFVKLPLAAAAKYKVFPSFAKKQTFAKGNFVFIVFADFSAIYDEKYLWYATR